YAMALDGRGNVYVGGIIGSTDFPERDAPTVARGNGFAARLDTGGDLVWSGSMQGYISAMAASPDGIIYIVGSQGPARNQIYRTTDRGASWSNPNFPDAVELLGIAVDPHNPARVYAYGPGSPRLSTDFGATFGYANLGSGSTRALAFDPVTP